MSRLGRPIRALWERGVVAAELRCLNIGDDTVIVLVRDGRIERATLTPAWFKPPQGILVGMRAREAAKWWVAGT